MENHVESSIPIVTSWPLISAKASKDHKTIVLLVERTDCAFCDTVKREFLEPMAASNRFHENVLFARVSLDEGEEIIMDGGHSLSTSKFCDRYKAQFAPTILFLDSDGRELSEQIIGISSRDYYGYYLEQGILKSTGKLSSL